MVAKADTIKAVIFDLNGVVIIDSHWHAITNAAIKKGEDRTDFHYRVHTKNIKNDIFWKIQTGRITEKEFWKDLDQNIKNLKILTEIRNQVYSLLIPKKGTLQIIEKLKARGYKLGLLTNFTKQWMDYLKTSKEGLYTISLFDAIVNSADIGIKKPDKRAYEIILNRLETIPWEAVLIDDREKNFKGAHQIGLNTILFSSATQLNKDLNNFGIKI